MSKERIIYVGQDKGSVVVRSNGEYDLVVPQGPHHGKLVGVTRKAAKQALEWGKRNGGNRMRD